MAMRVLSLVGRVFFALIFIVAAPRHFTAEGINHAADLGVPFAALCVPVSGLMALAGGLSVASGYRTQWGVWLLIAFLVPVTVMMHGFWRLHDPQAVHIQQAMFLKNVALVGGALLLAQLGSGL
jgi:putative oxidoreductase